MKYVSNAFSIKMINDPCHLSVSFLSRDKFMKEIKTAYSVVGHEQIAEYLGVPCNRETVSLKHGDILFVAVEGSKRGNTHFEFKLSPDTEKFYKIEIT